jgi:hypothetical protein
MPVSGVEPGPYTILTKPSIFLIVGIDFILNYVDLIVRCVDFILNYVGSLFITIWRIKLDNCKRVTKCDGHIMCAAECVCVRSVLRCAEHRYVLCVVLDSAACIVRAKCSV